MLPNFDKKNLAYMIGTTIASVAAYGVIDPAHVEPLTKFLSESAQSSLAQNGFFFLLAAWIHGGRVKKEIRLNFSGLTEAINNVANTLRAEIENHSEKQTKVIEQQGELLANVVGRVEVLEAGKPKTTI